MFHPVLDQGISRLYPSNFTPLPSVSNKLDELFRLENLSITCSRYSVKKKHMGGLVGDVLIKPYIVLRSVAFWLPSPLVSGAAVALCRPWSSFWRGHRRLAPAKREGP